MCFINLSWISSARIHGGTFEARAPMPSSHEGVDASLDIVVTNRKKINYGLKPQIRQAYASEGGRCASGVGTGLFYISL